MLRAKAINGINSRITAIGDKTNGGKINNILRLNLGDDIFHRSGIGNVDWRYIDSIAVPLKGGAQEVAGKTIGTDKPHAVWGLRHFKSPDQQQPFAGRF